MKIRVAAILYHGIAQNADNHTRFYVIQEPLLQLLPP